MANCCGQTEADSNYDGSCKLLNAAYIFAGLAMMLNIRLSYSSAPYALIRFQLPENLFSVFVRRMASALELWCLPSMLLGNIMDLLQKLIIYPKILQNEAGSTESDGGKLRQLAKALHQKAEGLNTEVNKAGTLSDSDGNAAKVLKHKAGNEATKGLRGLADTLYNKAASLHSAIGGTDDSKASSLANAVGERDEAPGGEGPTTLRQALNQLADASDPKSPASAVTSKYNAVNLAFAAVQGQKTTYTSAGHNAMYQAVEAAWNAFNEVYKPEELLITAIGPTDTAGTLGSPATLREALNQLSTADILQLHTRAEEVKKKFEGWGIGVLGKFGLVKAQENAYEADQSTIKTQKYDPVKNAFNDFNNLYRKAIYSTKFYSIIVPSIICQWLNFLTYVLLLVVYLMGGDTGHLTTFYFVIAISGVVFGINMTLVYSVDFYYIPVYIAGENSFPIVTSFIHYLSTLMFGNRRKWNSDFLLVKIDIWVAIIISLAAAIVWTLGYVCEFSGEYHEMKHIHAHGFGGEPNWYQLSPFLMIVVGMGLVYAIYPGIAPGMIVPFYLIDKIEMVLLIATIFPPVIIAILRIKAKAWSPQHNTGTWGLWKLYEYGFGPGPKTPVHAYLWHLFDLLMVIKISLAAIFIYSLHYRDSNLSRSIINQPKMSTALSITFYMCHEILLAVGFSGFIGNDGGDWILIPQYIGALFMIFLAFYSEGYIIEYKSHDPSHWPTEGMTPWNAFCYWCKRVSKITNHNLISLFKNYLFRGFTYVNYL